MPKPILAYWDIRCLAEPIRLMLEYIGIEFDDKRYPTGDAPMYARPEWEKDKQSMGFDFPNLPYWIDESIKLTESWAIMKYVARKYANLYPDNELEEMKCDLLQGRIEDFRNGFINMCYSVTKESQKELFESRKEKFLENLPKDLEEFEKFMQGSQWLTGSRILYVDFAFCECLDQIRLFMPSFLNKNPSMKKYLENFDRLKSIASYRESSRYHQSPINSKYYYWGGSKQTMPVEK